MRAKESIINQREQELLEIIHLREDNINDLFDKTRYEVKKYNHDWNTKSLFDNILGRSNRRNLYDKIVGNEQSRVRVDNYREMIITEKEKYIEALKEYIIILLKKDRNDPSLNEIKESMFLEKEKTFQNLQSKDINPMEHAWLRTKHNALHAAIDQIKDYQEGKQVTAADIHKDYRLKL